MALFIHYFGNLNLFSFVFFISISKSLLILIFSKQQFLAFLIFSFILYFIYSYSNLYFFPFSCLILICSFSNILQRKIRLCIQELYFLKLFLFTTINLPQNIALAVPHKFVAFCLFIVNFHCDFFANPLLIKDTVV